MDTFKCCGPFKSVMSLEKSNVLHIIACVVI